MMKEVVPTPAIVGQLNKSFGAPLDLNKVAIFEAIALNTQPISKRGSLYDQAVPQLSLLQGMASYVQSGGAVPLHTLHAQGYELPVGRVFMAEVFDGGELRVLFYLSREDSVAADLITKLNAGVIDEVSVGIQPAHLLCSECNFDFFGSEATVENLWDRTCPDDHTLGVAGVHGKLDGLDRFYETSLVSLGAAKNAKIVGRAKSRLGQEEYSRLAASGFDPDITALFATTGHIHHRTGGTPMADETLTASAVLGQIASLSADKAKVEVQLAASAVQVTDLTAKLEAATTRVTTVEGELAALRTETEAQLATAAEGVALKEDHDKIVAFLSEQTLAAMVASGVKTPVVPKDVPGMLAALEESKLKLHNLPKGPQLDPANIHDTKGSGYLPASSFSARRK